jgi:hypothetical protein
MISRVETSKLTDHHVGLGVRLLRYAKLVSQSYMLPLCAYELTLYMMRGQTRLSTALHAPFGSFTG